MVFPIGKAETGARFDPADPAGIRRCTPTMLTCSTWSLKAARRSDEPAGASTARVTVVERTGPEDPGPPASRDNDRLVVVTEGELTAEIAARPAAVPAQAVIVIPAGVPHRIWNSSPIPVRYLDADVPAPDAYAKLAPAR